MSHSTRVERRSVPLAPRTLLVVSAVLVSAMALFLSLLTPQAQAFPPGVPSKSQAQSELNGLTVRTEESMTGYSRDRFPHWISQGDGCDTRDVVLKRDADSYSGNCTSASGSWYSYYDGLTRTDPSDLDIDHVVALAEAWRSGARNWTDTKRRDFANDLTGPQLIAVTAESNRSKGDSDPTAWKPSRTGAHCGYAKFWIHSKHRWGLHLQSAEKTALQSMLNTCSY